MTVVSFRKTMVSRTTRIGSLPSNFISLDDVLDQCLWHSTVMHAFVIPSILIQATTTENIMRDLNSGTNYEDHFLERSFVIEIHVDVLVFKILSSISISLPIDRCFSSSYKWGSMPASGRGLEGHTYLLRWPWLRLDPVLPIGIDDMSHPTTLLYWSFPLQRVQ